MGARQKNEENSSKLEPYKDELPMWNYSTALHITPMWNHATDIRDRWILAYSVGKYSVCNSLTKFFGVPKFIDTIPLRRECHIFNYNCMWMSHI